MFKIPLRSSDADVPFTATDLRKYTLLSEGGPGIDRRELQVEAKDLPHAIEIAVRLFGFGKVELNVEGGKLYELQIKSDRSWSLHPVYKL